MKLTKDGFGQDDFKCLYEGFGFARKEKSGHTIYQHPDYPWLLATVGRHSNLAKGYAATAVKLIEEVLRLQEIDAEAKRHQLGG